ncbi:Cycloheximide resistance protein [Cytospora mali]|uniref:Cycloheximide resistance protein n=1 Tax=Cytospora mali TaxID=578113 RepID=A0A194VBU1_CYTMA|nr:Cycloheximide resistance protein [Valsa mali var. pyri (nom. inval.)]
MADLFRDASFGGLWRAVLGRHGFTYADEREGFQLPSRKDESTEPSGERDDSSAEDLEKQDEGSDSPVGSVDKAVDNVDWYGPDDPDNPQNWSFRKKAFVFVQIVLLTFCVYVGSSIITPAETKLREIYGISTQKAALSLSIYVLGYGCGPLFFSPLSEIPRLGRNIPYLTSFLLFIIITIPLATINSFPGFVILRFFQGFVGGPVLATGGATATDMFSFIKVPYAMAAWTAGAFAGPALGPLLAGFAVTYSTWRWSLYEMLIISVFTFAFLFFCLPETNGDTILLHRARRLRKLMGDINLRAQSERKQGELHLIQAIKRSLTTPFMVTFLDPSVAFMHLYCALTYAIYYSYFESFPLVYQGIYGFSLGIMGVAFVALMVACFLGAIIYCSLVWFIYEPYTMKNGIGLPETRLVPGIFAGITAPIGIFIFGWTARSDIHWIVPTIGVVIYSASQFMLIAVIFIYLPISYPRYAASIFAGNTFLRSALACGAIHFAQPLFNNLGIGKGCSVLGGLTAGCFLGFTAFWHFGPKLRARSRFAETY